MRSPRLVSVFSQRQVSVKLGMLQCPLPHSLNDLKLILLA